MQDAVRLNELRQLAGEKLFSLEKEKIIETDVNVKFKLEKQIAELTEQRQRFEA